MLPRAWREDVGTVLGPWLHQQKDTEHTQARDVNEDDRCDIWDSCQHFGTRTVRGLTMRPSHQAEWTGGPSPLAFAPGHTLPNTDAPKMGIGAKRRLEIEFTGTR